MSTRPLTEAKREGECQFLRQKTMMNVTKRIFENMTMAKKLFLEISPGFGTMPTE